MKHLKLLAVSAVALVATCIAWAGVARAQQFTPHVAMGKTIDSSVLSAAKTVNIDGTVNGDVYCAGQDVTISGTVHGDVICAAQHVTISGTVDGSMRIVAQKVDVAAKIGRGVSVIGQNIMFSRAAVVGQDAVIAGTSVQLEGVVKRDAVLNGTDVHVSASVGRNVRFGGSQLSLDNGTAIAGSVNYTSRHMVAVANGANVKGATVHQATAKPKGTRIFGRTILTAILLVIAFVVFSLFVVRFFPKQLQGVTQVAVDSLGKTTLVGFASIFVVPFAISLLAATIIGIPIAIVLLLVALLILMLSLPVAAYYFGSMLWAKQRNPVRVMLVGSLLVSIVFMVPVVGGLFTLVSYIIGSGSLILSIFKQWPKPSRKAKTKA
ncbi:MAG TPA: polymer-forming cytoskeletal protein [Candidatus Saccharimonadales bacterium]|nr:polymer-forming cytoskeletal protein [Candidatus Saccharimonadales bacterium]